MLMIQLLTTQLIYFIITTGFLYVAIWHFISLKHHQTKVQSPRPFPPITLNLFVKLWRWLLMLAWNLKHGIIRSQDITYIQKCPSWHPADLKNGISRNWLTSSKSIRKYLSSKDPILEVVDRVVLDVLSEIQTKQKVLTCWAEDEWSW